MAAITKLSWLRLRWATTLQVTLKNWKYEWHVKNEADESATSNQTRFWSRYRQPCIFSSAFMLYLTTSFYPNIETVAAYVSSLRRGFCKLSCWFLLEEEAALLFRTGRQAISRWPGKRWWRNDERRIDTYQFNFDKFYVCARMNPELRNQFGCRLVDPGYCARVPCTMLDRPSMAWDQAKNYGFRLTVCVSVCNVIRLISSTIYHFRVIFVYNLPHMVTQECSNKQ